MTDTVFSADALASATRMGERAGRAFLATGVWPKCPFTDDAVQPLRQAWADAVFGVTGPALKPATAPSA